MKKTILGFALVFTLGVNLLGQIGHLDIEALKSEMPEMLGAEAKLASYKNKLQEKRTRKLAKKSLPESVDLNIPASAPLTKNKFTGKWKVNGEKFNETTMLLMVIKKRGKLIKPIHKKIDSAIKKVAKENELLIILDQDTSVILFAEETLDVSELVRRKLGM